MFKNAGNTLKNKDIISTAKSFSEMESENPKKIDIKTYETLKGITSGLINIFKWIPK